MSLKTIKKSFNQLKPTRNSLNKFDEINFFLIALINKIGSDRVRDLLFTLSQDTESMAASSIVKAIVSSYYCVSVDQIVNGTTHDFSKMRSVCYYILHSYGVQMRSIGSSFGKSERSVHAQIDLARAVMKRPSTNKDLYQALVINGELFEKSISAITKEASDHIRGEDDQVDPFCDIRTLIIEKIKSLNLSINHASKMVGMPRQSLSSFLNNKQGIKTEHLLKIQKCFNIKLI